MASFLITMGQAFGEALPTAIRHAGGSVEAIRVGPTEVEVVASFDVTETREVQRRLFAELPGPSISVEEW